MMKDIVKKAHLKNSKDLEEFIKEQVVERVRFHCGVRYNNCEYGLFNVSDKELINNSMAILEFEAIKNANGKIGMLRRDSSLLEQMAADHTIKIMNPYAIQSGEIVTSVQIEATPELLYDLRTKAMKEIVEKENLNTVQEVQEHFAKRNMLRSAISHAQVGRFATDTIFDKKLDNVGENVQAEGLELKFNG